MEKRLTDKGGEREGEGEMNEESSTDAWAPTLVTRQPVGICCLTQGTQTLIAWRGGNGRDVGGRFKSEGPHVPLRLIHVDV